MVAILQVPPNVNSAPMYTHPFQPTNCNCRYCTLPSYNLTVTDGTINAFIMHTNVAGVNSDMFRTDTD